MGDDEVLAAGLSDQTRVGPVLRDVLAHPAPDRLEYSRAAGEMDAREVRRGEGDIGDHPRIAREEIDDAFRHARFLEDVHDHPGAAHRGMGGLPEDDVPHEGGGGDEVPAYG